MYSSVATACCRERPDPLATGASRSSTTAGRPPPPLCCPRADRRPADAIIADLSPMVRSTCARRRPAGHSRAAQQGGANSGASGGIRQIQRRTRYGARWGAAGTCPSPGGAALPARCGDSAPLQISQHGGVWPTRRGAWQRGGRAELTRQHPPTFAPNCLRSALSPLSSAALRAWQRWSGTISSRGGAARDGGRRPSRLWTAAPAVAKRGSKAAGTLAGSSLAGSFWRQAGSQASRCRKLPAARAPLQKCRLQVLETLQVLQANCCTDCDVGLQ